MSLFTQHTEATAPAESAAILGQVKARYGFIPNLAAYLAESPSALGAVLHLAGAVDKSSLTPQEQQIVQLTISVLNGCGYCKTAHTGMGKMAGIDEATISAVVGLTPLPDARHDALRNFTQKVVDERGWVSEADVRAFLDAGYTRAHVFDVVLAVANKVLTNYTNHIVGTLVNEEFVAMAEGKIAA